MATTFTLVAVFVPVAFMQGIVGQFFRQFGLTISVAVLISLFVAFTLDPMLSARLARRPRPRRAPPGAGAGGRLRRLFERTTAPTSARSTGCSGTGGSPWARPACSSLASLVVGSRLGSEFVPAEDRSQLVVNLEFPPGTSLATTSALSRRLEREVQALPGVAAVYSTLGPQEDVRLARWRVNLVDKARRAETAEPMKRRDPRGPRRRARARDLRRLRPAHRRGAGRLARPSSCGWWGATSPCCAARRSSSSTPCAPSPP